MPAPPFGATDEGPPGTAWVWFWVSAPSFMKEVPLAPTVARVAAFAVLFGTEPFASDPVAAAFPTGFATSRSIGSLPGFAYPSASVSRWWTVLDSVKRVLSAAG